MLRSHLHIPMLPQLSPFSALLEAMAASRGIEDNKGSNLVTFPPSQGDADQDSSPIGVLFSTFYGPFQSRLTFYDSVIVDWCLLCLSWQKYVSATQVLLCAKKGKNPRYAGSSYRELV